MNRMFARALLAGGLLAALMAAPAARSEDEPPEPPLGLPPIYWPDDNPYSREKAELGRLLYFDKRLSSDGTIACASCHEPRKAFTDGQPVSVGIGKQRGGRNAPTVINRAYSLAQFWDGRAATLEEQVKGPLANPLEMTTDKESNVAHEAVVRRIRGIPGYVERFRKVFGPGEFNIDSVAKAIATFERTILSGNAPYDRYQAGDKSALTAEQVRGKDVFFKKGACDACHVGFNFTDGSFENIGIGMDKPEPDLGRYVVTHKEEDRGAFKTPTLREIEHTAPYMHDGSLVTLEEVVEHYNKGGIKNPYLSQKIRPLNLTEQEKKDLVAFLKALSGEGWQHIQEPKPEEFPR
ncbi:MAG: cytochrome-c peroxidase [Isosphaeraceae bacterium]|nr:cytochrome-c peroxidase [Isosphaeraceae bacterium]